MCNETGFFCKLVRLLYEYMTVISKRQAYKILIYNLRLLTESLILIGSVMFGATFNLVIRVGLK